MPTPAAFHQLLHHVALLVAFDWEHSLIVPWVVVGVYRLLKGLVEALEPVFENVVETDQ
jgi:hypothetical protein